MYRIANLTPGDYVVVAPIVPVTVPASSQGPGNRPNLQSTAPGLTFGQPMPGSGGQAIGPDARFLLQRGIGTSGDIAAAPDASGRIVGFSTVYYPNAPTASGRRTSPSPPVKNARASTWRYGVSRRLRFLDSLLEARTALLLTTPFDWSRRTRATSSRSLSQPWRCRTPADCSCFSEFLQARYIVQVVRISRRAPPVEFVARAGGPEPVALAQFQAMQAAQAAMEPLLWASVPISVSDSDVHGLALTLREGLTVSGRLEFSGSRPRPDPQRLAQAQIMIEPADGRMPEYDQGPPSRVQADGRFTTTGRLPGRYFIRPGGVAGGWNLQSITANGVDVDGQSHRPFQQQRQQRRHHVHAI